MLASNFLIWWAAQVAAVAILVALFLRWRPGFLRRRSIKQALDQALDSRQQEIHTQLEAAEKSREEAARIHEQSQHDLAEARREGERIVQRAGTTSEAIEREMRQRAQEEYERIVAQAKTEIELERERAELALRRRAADIVVDAAGQVVRDNLPSDIDRRIIDEAMDHMERP